MSEEPMIYLQWITLAPSAFRYFHSPGALQTFGLLNVVYSPLQTSIFPPPNSRCMNSNSMEDGCCKCFALMSVLGIAFRTISDTVQGGRPFRNELETWTKRGSRLPEGLAMFGICPRRRVNQTVKFGSNGVWSCLLNQVPTTSFENSSSYCLFLVLSEDP
jgi:hypothetical protein